MIEYREWKLYFDGAVNNRGAGLGVILVTQEGPKGVEHIVYYLSKKFLHDKEKYNLVEKTCLIMIWATKKLRHYFQSYKIQAISKIDPLRYLFQVPALTR